MEEIAAGESLEQVQATGAPSRRFLLRYLRPKMGVVLLLWRVEARSATPLALLLIATMGRWPAALVMGSVMAVFAAVFIYLLDDDPALDDIRAWADGRRLGRALERLADRSDAVGKMRRAAALAPAVMLLGPFWRAVTFRLFRMRRPAAYLLSVGGSIPHALLWVGLVLGGLWEGFVWPLVRKL